MIRKMRDEKMLNGENYNNEIWSIRLKHLAVIERRC
jgi:hypothetical protein